MEKSAQIDSIAHNANGLSLLGAVTFILGDIAGTGILALPDAVKGTGWSGFALITFCSLLATYSGLFLSRSWLILEERFPEYRDKKVRIPYATIAHRSIGPKTATLATCTMNMQLFGCSIVFILLSAEMVQYLLRTWIDITFCHWIVIAGFFLMPFTFFGSPADFWLVGLLGSVGTVVSAVLITYSSAENHDSAALDSLPDPTIRTYFLSVGTLMFGVSGACALPTFQNDMKDKKKFSMACVISFALTCVVYLVVSVAGYVSFGSNLQTNVVRNLPQNSVVTTIINIFMTCHVFCGFLILINPVNQSFEDYLQIHHSFNWKRCGFRALVVLVSMFIGLTVPRFGKVLNFIGASASTMNTFIFPPLFYICLCKQRGLGWPDHKITKLTWTIAIVMMVAGLFAACSGSVFALLEIIAPRAFTLPCYLDVCASELPIEFTANLSVGLCSQQTTTLVI